MENNNIRMFTFDDEQTPNSSTGYVSVGQNQQSTIYINKFPEELDRFYNFNDHLTDYISGLIREYVDWNNGEPVLFNPMNTQDIAGDPDGSGWSIYGFGIISDEPSVFIIKEGCADYNNLIKSVPDSNISDDACYALEVMGVANPYELIRIFLNNTEQFKELGLPNLKLR